MLTLYRFPGATCAAKVLMALADKQASFEDKVITRDDLASEWYRKLNPNGVVPTITHKGETIIESSVILNYIEDSFGGVPLRPSDPLDRAKMNFWLKFLDDALDSLGTVTYAFAGRQAYLSKAKEEREAYYRGIPDFQLRQSRRNAIELGFDAPEIPYAVSVLTDLQRRANAAAQEGRFLAGDYSLADISLTPFITRLDVLGLLAPKSELPAFYHWWEKICVRPSFEVAVSSTPAQRIEELRKAVSGSADRIEALRKQA
jgi:glutathione S-transferase